MSDELQRGSRDRFASRLRDAFEGPRSIAPMPHNPDMRDGQSGYPGQAEDLARLRRVERCAAQLVGSLYEFPDDPSCWQERIDALERALAGQPPVRYEQEW